MFPQLLRERRLAQGLSYRALGRAAAIDHVRLYNFEHGLVPRRNEILRLAGVLSCTPADLGLSVETEPEVRELSIASEAHAR